MGKRCYRNWMWRCHQVHQCVQHICSISAAADACWPQDAGDVGGSTVCGSIPAKSTQKARTPLHCEHHCSFGRLTSHGPLRTPKWRLSRPCKRTFASKGANDCSHDGSLTAQQHQLPHSPGLALPHAATLAPHVPWGPRSAGSLHG